MAERSSPPDTLTLPPRIPIDGGGPSRPSRRVGWAVVAAMVLAVAGWALVGGQARPAEAAGVTTFYLHGGGPYTMDGTIPSGTRQSFVVMTGGATRTWATTTPTAVAQTIPATDSFRFHYWSGPGGTALTRLTFGYSPVSSCASSVTKTIAATGTYSPIAGSANPDSTPSFSPASDVTVPAGVYFCWTITVTFVTGGGTTLYSDTSTDQTNFTSADAILIGGK